MVGTRWRLTYTDSGGTKQTIAELGQDTGAKKIDHMRYILKRKNPWIMKVFTDPSVLKAFPNEVSEYQSDEPEILFEEYDGGWTTRGRFYSASQTQEDNEFAIQLLDFYHKVMNQEASVTSTTTNIVDAMAKALPAGYVLDTPDEVDVTGGYPSVDNYSAQNTQVRKVYRELTRDNNWALFFLPEQDGSGDWKVRFEPDGFGGTVNSYDTSTDNVTIKQWQPPRKRNLITKTLVEGVDSSGSKITATAENTTIRDKYLGTRSTDHNFKSYKVGYLESQSEADKIAENRLVPGPNATTVKDQGILKDTIYVQDVVNDSFGLTDNFRGINDTFTCVKQENFYPSNTSYLHLEFESEELEKAAEGQENLRDERARLYPSSTQQENVGEQDFTGDTGSAPSDTAQTGSVDQDPSDTAVIGSLEAITNGSLAGNSDSAFQSEAINSSGWDFITTVSASTDALAHLLQIQVTDIDTTTNLEFVVATGGTVRMMWQAKDVGSNSASGIAAISVDNYMVERGVVSMIGFTGGQTLDYDLYVASQGSNAPTCDFEIEVTELNHTHPDTYDTDDFDHPHGDNFDTDDFNHGGAGDATGQHGASGTTDPKNIDITAAQEDKTDR